MSSFVDASVIWEQLRRLVRESATGMLFLTSEDGAAGRIGVKGGAIVFVAFRFSAGKAALPLLAELKKASWRFEEKTPGPLPNMPSTQEILEALGVAPGGSMPAGSPSAGRVSVRPSPARPPSGAHSFGIPPPARVPSTAPPALGSSKPASDEVKAELSKILAEYMGPIAPIVFDEHWEKSQKNGLPLEALIDALAKELQGPRSTEFRTRALAKIR